MKIGVVVKATVDAVRLQQLRAALSRLRAFGHEVHVRETRRAGDARPLARAAARVNCDVVIAAGGDGTVNEVANALARAEASARLAILPLGTANDFARGLGIPIDVDAAADVVLRGNSRPLDLGCVNGRYFVNVSTGGFGAHAATNTPRTLKRVLGPFAYVLTGAKQLIGMRPQRARFVVDGAVVHDGQFVFFTCGNGVSTGGGTRIAPRASVRDGQLDVVILPWVSRLEFLALLPDLRSGSHLESPDVLYLRAAHIEVHAAEALEVGVDGEPVHARDLAYSVHAHPLSIVVP